MACIGSKQAENEPKTTYVSDQRLSLGENLRFQKWAFSASLQAENDPFINSGTEFFAIATNSVGINLSSVVRYRGNYHLWMKLQSL